jgi:hypothetical protein
MATRLIVHAAKLNWISNCFAHLWLKLDASIASCNVPYEHSRLALTPHERTRAQLILNALVAAAFLLKTGEWVWILRDCDWHERMLRDDEFARTLNLKGFWRVDKDKHPEHRHTVLSLVAFQDLQEKIAASGGEVAAGIEAFCNQNDGEGWMLPETLRLADYGLGHDERAREHQPVRECFGARFYDWQLAQTPEESWRECHLHARNLLGPEAYQRLIDEIEGHAPHPGPLPTGEGDGRGGGHLFETEHLPLFDAEQE